MIDDEIPLVSLHQLCLHQMITVAITMGLLPQPHGYDAEGNPIWSLEKMAEHFGRTLQDARDWLWEHPEMEFRTGDPDEIRRVH